MSNRVQSSSDHRAPVQLKKQKGSPAPSAGAIGQQEQVDDLDLGQQDFTFASSPSSPTTITTVTTTVSSNKSSRSKSSTSTASDCLTYTSATSSIIHSKRSSSLLSLYKSMDDLMDLDDSSTVNLSYDELKNQVRLLQEALRSRDVQIVELRSQLDKYQAVFAFSPTTNLLSPGVPGPPPIVSLKKRTRTRLIGISAEPAPGDSTSAGSTVQEHIRTFPKDDATTKLLEQAIQSNDFMKRLDSGQITELVACMYPVIHPPGETIIREGEDGNQLYIIESGCLEAFNETVRGRRLTRGMLFGELALLYNCKRTASVRVCGKEELISNGHSGSGAHLWVLERTAFQHVMVERGTRKRSQIFKFLKSVKLFADLSEESLSKVVDVTEEKDYRPGDYIIRQGARGDTFFVIQRGDVRVTQNQESGDEVLIRKMHKGDFFGEKALTAPTSPTASSPSTPSTSKISDNSSGALRTANVIAEDSPDDTGVSCLVIDRDAFHQLISNRIHNFVPPSDTEAGQNDEQGSFFDRVSIDDITKVATLGVGGFGRVELVSLKNQANDNASLALKIMKRRQIVETRQQTHILSEKNIMSECNSPFIVRLFKTFKDKTNLYMLMEVCLGGELWTLLRDRGFFDENMTRFYVGCVCTAFDYLHSKNIIYRDLKPENMLLDDYGYIKLTDFGFAKKLLPPGRKTWTFCGTPEYVAPEIILNRGHDYAADYWSLGVLMFELLTGAPPFSGGQDPMKTYNIILRGIDAIDFPRHISKDATLLIKRLCRETPTERLGYIGGGIAEIKSNRWFDGFHWEALEKRTMPAPYVPPINGPLDTSNFDFYPPEEPDFSTFDASFDNGWDDGF